MATADPHTVKAFDEDLEEIRALVAQMGGMVELAISRAFRAMADHDEATAARIAAEDEAIDRLSQEVERQCVRIVALRAPMADDLREVLAAFKQATIIERMGDCARGIAAQVPLVRGIRSRRSRAILERMSEKARDMVRLSLDCAVQRNADAARPLCAPDDLLASLHDELLGELLDIMIEEPSSITASTCLLLASQKLVRLGEHSANLARLVCFALAGADMNGSAGGGRGDS